MTKFETCRHCGQRIWTAPYGRFWLAYDEESDTNHSFCRANVREEVFIGPHEPGEYVKPVEVGDVLRTVGELDALPIKAAVVAPDGDVYQKLTNGEWATTGSEIDWVPGLILGYGSATVVFLPDKGA